MTCPCTGTLARTLAGVLLVAAIAGAPARPAGAQIPLQSIPAVTTHGQRIDPAAEVIPLALVLHSPAAYARNPVVTEGVVTSGCTERGCWIELAPDFGKPSIRVTFANFGFTIPASATGSHARIQGRILPRRLTPTQVAQLLREGGRMAINPDGSADELTFVATGVIIFP